MRLLDLFSDCPCGEGLHDCPAREFRKLSVADRAIIVHGVGAEAIDRFLNHHALCLRQRQED
jgi:hypothetical protein